MATTLEDLKKRMALKVPAIVPAPSSATPAPVSSPALLPAVASNTPLFIPEHPKTPSRLGFELQEKVAQLQAALLERHPKMPVLLREIHTTLRAQPENVTLMSEEEIAILVDGLKIQTGVEFAQSMVKGPGSKSTAGKIKQLGLGAF